MIQYWGHERRVVYSLKSGFRRCWQNDKRARKSGKWQKSDNKRVCLHFCEQNFSRCFHWVHSPVVIWWLFTNSEKGTFSVNFWQVMSVVTNYKITFRAEAAARRRRSVSSSAARRTWRRDVKMHSVHETNCQLPVSVDEKYEEHRSDDICLLLKHSQKKVKPDVRATYKSSFPSWRFTQWVHSPSHRQS